jgi:hypothetical protein
LAPLLVCEQPSKPRRRFTGLQARDGSAAADDLGGAGLAQPIGGLALFHRGKINKIGNIKLYQSLYCE